MRYRDSWKAEKNGTWFEFTDTIGGEGNWKNSAMLFWVSSNISAATGVISSRIRIEYVGYER